MVYFGGLFMACLAMLKTVVSVMSKGHYGIDFGRPQGRVDTGDQADNYRKYNRPQAKPP